MVQYSKKAVVLQWLQYATPDAFAAVPKNGLCHGSYHRHNYTITMPYHVCAAVDTPIRGYTGHTRCTSPAYHAFLHLPQANNSAAECGRRHSWHCFGPASTTSRTSPTPAIKRNGQERRERPPFHQYSKEGTASTGGQGHGN